jgi:uncharacterized membrane protein
LSDDIVQSPEEETFSLRQQLRLESSKSTLVTLVFGLTGAVLFALVHVIPMPFVMVSLLKFSLIPSLVIIALVGAIRGSLAGFITGYFGLVLYDLVFFHTVLTYTIPAVAYGILGLIVGIGSYDFDKGRSLGKLSIISAIGLVFTALILSIINLYIDQHSILVALGFTLLPHLTAGLPTLIFVTPILARIWSLLAAKINFPWDLS